MDVDDDLGRYCRDLETYLCQKNEGHRVRIVGPAFEQVCEWGRRGVPLGVAQRGIDRYVERYYAKGPKRRPVRIEFCEADVLDAFDEWRRALGLPISTTPVARELADGAYARADAPARVAAPEPAAPERRDSLSAHLERAIARLTVARGGAPAALNARIDAVVRELDTMRADAKSLRGGARDAVLSRLVALDRELVETVRAHCGAAALAQVEREANAELAPFKARMLAEAYERSRSACVDRLLRERARLPVLTVA